MTKFFKDSEILDYFYEALEDENISFEYYNITRRTLSNFLMWDFITLDDAEVMMNFINDYFYEKYEDFEPFSFEELYDVEHVRWQTLRWWVSKVSNNIDLSFDINAGTWMRMNRKWTTITSFENNNNWEYKSRWVLKTEEHLKDLYQKIILNNNSFPFDEEWDFSTEVWDRSKGIIYNNQ